MSKSSTSAKNKAKHPERQKNGYDWVSDRRVKDGGYWRKKRPRSATVKTGVRTRPKNAIFGAGLITTAAGLGVIAARSKRKGQSSISFSASQPLRGNTNRKVVALAATGGGTALAAGTSSLIKYKINNDEEFEAFTSAAISVGQENMQVIAKKVGVEDIGQTLSDALYSIKKSRLSKKDLDRQEKISVERIAKTTLGGQQEVIEKGEIPNELPSNWKTFTATDQDRIRFLSQTLNDDSRKSQILSDLDKYYKNKNDLSPEELSALRHYTDPVGYREMNATLRGDKKSKDFTMNFLKKKGDKRTLEEVEERAILESRLAVSALNKMPDYKGKVYRGGNYPKEYIDSLEIGSKIEDKAFTSTTKSLPKKFPGNTQFIIRSSTGKYISQYMNEAQEEVLFRPQTSFEVRAKKTVKLGKKTVTVIYMNELSG